MKAITGATLIDGRGGPSLPNATVLVEGGRIVAAGASAQVDVPDGAEVVQARGLTLLPGLIDCHDHLANFGYEIASRWGITETRRCGTCALPRCCGRRWRVATPPCATRAGWPPGSATRWTRASCRGRGSRWR